MPTLRILVGPCLLILLLAVGCGAAKKTSKVEGVVIVDGKPMPGVAVKFVNQDKKSRDADGYTDENGVFRLTTFNTNDGAVPGSYKVTLSKPLASEGNAADSPTVDPKQPQSMINAMQGYAQTQGKGAGKPKSALPDVYAKADSTPLKYEIPYDGKIEIEISSKAK